MKSRKEEPAVISWIRPVLTGTAAGALACALLLLAFAAVMSVRDVPQGAVTPLALTAAAAGAFAGGFVCARKARARGLAFGALCGLVLYLLTMLAGFAALQDMRGLFALLKLLLMVFCGAAGGVAGINFRRR